MTPLSGIYAPIPTPFDNNEAIAYDKLEFNLSQWTAGLLSGIVMPGSNSEAAFLTHEERVQLWQVCAALLRGTDKHLIAGTGVETTAETIALTQQAADAGAIAALVLPPHFYKSALTHDVLVAHYRAVADASPIPLLLYNVPVFTGIDFAPATLLALAEHPRIVGIKDSSANVAKMSKLLAVYPEFRVFSGSTSAFLPFLSIGAVGSIVAMANIAAVPLHRLVAAFHAGDMAEARQIQHSLLDLNAAVTARFGIPGLKYAMDQLGLYGGPTRRPLLPLEREARAEIDRLLDTLLVTQ